jgi:hypothetical protein
MIIPYRNCTLCRYFLSKTQEVAVKVFKSDIKSLLNPWLPFTFFKIEVFEAFICL